MNVLLSGPWVGEFGWEIMKWVPFVRYEVENNKYDDVIICTKHGNEYLYKDIAKNFIYVNRSIKNIMGCKYNNMNPSFKEDEIENIKSRYNKKTKITILSPNNETLVSNNNKLKYIKYGKVDKIYKYDILIHARSTNNMNSNFKNWSINKWNDFALFYKNKDIKIGCIGKKNLAYVVKNTDNLLDIDLETLCNIMANSRIILGPSSGPMHLASLCKLPHLVWTDKILYGGIGKKDNRYRYEKLWNPFNTKCWIMDDCNWNPHLTDIAKFVRNYLMI